MNKILSSFLMGCLSILIIGCEQEKKELPKIDYKGPMSVTDNLNVTYSDSGQVKIKLSTARQLKFADENEFYPKPVFVTFYDKNNFAYTTIRGDSARYLRSQNIYKIMGNVFLLNQTRNESISTPILYWDANKREISSDKAVTLKNPIDEVHGVGFVANQDFTNVRIKKMTGNLAVDMGDDAGVADSDTL